MHTLLHPLIALYEEPINISQIIHQYTGKPYACISGFKCSLSNMLYKATAHNVIAFNFPTTGVYCFLCVFFHYSFQKEREKGLTELASLSKPIKGNEKTQM